MTDDTKPPEPAAKPARTGTAKTAAKTERAAGASKRTSSPRRTTARKDAPAYDDGYRSSRRVWPD